MKTLYNLIVTLSTLALLLAGSPTIATHAQQPSPGSSRVYLPAIVSNYNPLAGLRTINATGFGSGDVLPWQMSIAWFGRVDRSQNYTDVRVGYNQLGLQVLASIFDRQLWGNPSSNGSDLTSWDAISLLVDTSGGNPSSPGATSYRFDAEFSPGYWNLANYQKAYRGNGSGWSAQSIPFTTLPGWRGPGFNDESVDAKGWVMTFTIPFASLGLSMPPEGTVWRMGLLLYDRDTAAAPASLSFTWPETAANNSPSTWGVLHFGVPGYAAPPATSVNTISIYQGFQGAMVPDAGVGGGSVCGGSVDYWTGWGYLNYAGLDYFNVQNQTDVADWPCYSKYYVTFPLNLVPPGKVIRSAKLVLHVFGGSDPTQAYDSYDQVLSVADDWSESTINWNNAPLPLENFGTTVVNVFRGTIDWANLPAYQWDVSQAAANAYNTGSPLRLAVYSADAAMHSGKYFVSSDTGDWDKQNRPTLVVEYGTP